MILGLYQGHCNGIRQRGTFVHTVTADRLIDLAAFSVNTGSDVVQAGAVGTLASACL